MAAQRSRKKKAENEISLWRNGRCGLADFESEAAIAVRLPNGEISDNASSTMRRMRASIRDREKRSIRI